jgi:Magnesium chelatase, subunit ChlI C-terminal
VVVLARALDQQRSEPQLLVGIEPIDLSQEVCPFGGGHTHSIVRCALSFNCHATTVISPRVDYDKLSGSRLSEPSSAIRARVEKARQLQHARFHDSKLACNADMGPAEVRQFCELDEVSRSLLRSAAQQMQLSARTYHRLLKVGRTIADLAGSERIQTAHLAEAIQI